jgi:Homoserine dehydrogenase
MIGVGLLGFGTVGGGVYQILKSKKDYIKRKLGEDIVIKKILVTDINKKRKYCVDKFLLTDKFEDIVNDSSIHVVVELIGGEEPSFSYIKAAIKNKNI